MSASSASHAWDDTVRFRKPFTTLYEATLGSFSTSQRPMSPAVSSGFLRETLSRGNTTSVKCPSNSRFVFCTCIIPSGTSCP